MGISSEHLLCLLFLISLSILCLASILIMFTCYQAKKVRNKPRGIKIPIHNQELVNKVRSELDDKYSSIPEEYLDQNSSIAYQERRSSSTSGYFSTSSSRSRSNSQEAVDHMLQMLISPNSMSVSNKKSGKNNIGFEETLSMFRGTDRHDRGSRRISWPGDKEKTKDARKKDRQSRSLDVIMESEESGNTNKI